MKHSFVNRLLLLKLVELSKEKLTERKINYLIYILQVEGRKENKQTFNYEYIKWNIDPYSEEVGIDIAKLTKEGLILKDNGIELTSRGREIIEKTNNFYEQYNIEDFFRFFVYIHKRSSLFSISRYIAKKYKLECIDNKKILLKKRKHTLIEIKEVNGKDGEEEEKLKIEINRIKQKILNEKTQIYEKAIEDADWYIKCGLYEETKKYLKVVEEKIKKANEF